MTNEIMVAIQTKIQEVSDFNDSSVVIIDESILDESFAENLPVVVIFQSGLVSGNYDSMDCAIRTWEVPVFIIDQLIDWKTSIQAIAAYRTNVLEHFDILDNRALGISDHYVSLNGIRDINPAEPVVAYEDPYTTSQMDLESLPMLLDIGLIFTIEERFN